jgi:hypothetical protein
VSSLMYFVVTFGFSLLFSEEMETILRWGR